jgi:hypothetical protein
VRARVVTRDDAAARSLAGAVLSHDVHGDPAHPSFAKGRVLRSEDVPALLALPWQELHVIEMEPGDLHEEEAGDRLAVAVAGDGCEVRAPTGGHWPIAATRRGILDVRVSALRACNEIDDVCVYTLYAGRIAEVGDVIARAKVTPFVLAEARVGEVERIAAEQGGLVHVRPFLPTRVGAVVQESLGTRAMDRFRDALVEKIAWFGSELIEPVFVPAGAEPIAGALRGLADQGARVLLVAGTKAMDALDPAFRALAAVGAPIERHGVPAHPGSLFWLARMGDVPILGMPSCGLFSQATVFDLVLPRVLAGERIGRADLAELGHGGLLNKELAFRFPPYRAARTRGEVGEGDAGRERS